MNLKWARRLPALPSRVDATRATRRREEDDRPAQIAGSTREAPPPPPTRSTHTHTATTLRMSLRPHHCSPAGGTIGGLEAQSACAVAQTRTSEHAKGGYTWEEGGGERAEKDLQMTPAGRPGDQVLPLRARPTSCCSQCLLAGRLQRLSSQRPSPRLLV